MALALGTGIKTTLSFTRWDYPGWQLPTWLWVIWATLIIFASAHAVNVTDGLDGLAAGIVAVRLHRLHGHRLLGLPQPDIYEIVNPLDLAVLAVALAGACAGFLWWNAAPARIFMGDVGSLGLGAALGLLARHHQHPAAAADHRRPPGDGDRQRRPADGHLPPRGRKRRLFKMSPIHHHFELIGLAGDDGHHPVLGDLGHLRGRSRSASTTPTG